VSLSAAVLDALIATGATREQLAAVMRADIAEREAEEAAKLEAKREGNRTRQARKRMNDSNAKSRVTAVTARDSRDTSPKVSPKENNQTPSSPPVDASEAEASSHQPRAWSLPGGVSLQVWDDFKRNRAKKRLPNTDTAWKAFLDDVSRVSSQTGIPPPKLIELCTAKGWGAIYDPRTDNEQRTNTLGRHQPTDGLSSTARAALSVFGH
jgi:hypothetical protein